MPDRRQPQTVVEHYAPYVRDAIRLVILGFASWAVVTLNTVENNTALVDHRLKRLELRLDQVEDKLNAVRRAQ
jgi:hypothetical protein